MSGRSGLLSQEVYTLALFGLIFCIPLHKHIGNFWIRALAFGMTLLLDGLYLLFIECTVVGLTFSYHT